jgi:hypothetical protein
VIEGWGGGQRLFTLAFMDGEIVGAEGLGRTGEEVLYPALDLEEVRLELRYLGGAPFPDLPHCRVAARTVLIQEAAGAEPYTAKEVLALAARIPLWSWPAMLFMGFWPSALVGLVASKVAGSDAASWAAYGTAVLAGTMWGLCVAEEVILRAPRKRAGYYPPCARARALGPWRIAALWVLVSVTLSVLAVWALSAPDWLRPMFD